METIKEAYFSAPDKAKNMAVYLYRLPVCYTLRFCEDVALFSARGIDHGTLIQKHTEPTYNVYMLGFLPGFVYLGGLDPKLAMPRRKSPRPKVEKGAVGIAGQQTGIYPMESPGGWNIIGRTPFPLFLPQNDPPVILQAGDRVRFYAIDEAEFFDLKEWYLQDRLDYSSFRQKWDV